MKEATTASASIRLDERKTRLAQAFQESRIAAQVLHERFAPPITPYDTPPSYSRLQRALGLGLLIRSIPEEDIARFMTGEDTLHHSNPFRAKNVHAHGDTYHATFGDGSTYTYEVTPRTSYAVTHNDVNVNVPDSLDARLERVNTPFARDTLYSGTTTLAIPEAYLEPAQNGTPLQKFRTTEHTLHVYAIGEKSAELTICLPQKKVPRFRADFD